MTCQIFSILLLSWIFNSNRAVHLLNTTSGIYVGRTVNYRSITVKQYLGIEYGRSKKRFDRAEPIIRQNDKIINATSFGPVCKQAGNSCETNIQVYPPVANCSVNYGIFSIKSLLAEECLFLNVYIPVTDKKNKKAIFMWIHGGSGQLGTGNIFDGTILAALGDIIVVTFNFRLNLFGFLSSGDTRFEGNLGLYDQSLVLDWIYRNGQAFNGDIQRITVGGHSAGAPHAYYLAESRFNRGRIRRLLLQSGCPFNVWSHIKPDEAMEKFNIVAHDNECGSMTTFDEKLKCLREKDFNLLTEQRHNGHSSANHTNVVISGDFMSNFREDLEYNNTLVDVDILIGSVDDEGIYAAISPVLVEECYPGATTLDNINYTLVALKFLAVMQPNKTCLHEKALELYHINKIPDNCSYLPDCYCSLFYNYTRLISDVLFYNDYYRFIKQRIKYSNKTFIYQYSHRTSQDHRSECNYYIHKHNLVGHFAELEYTWGTPLLFDTRNSSNNLIPLINYISYGSNNYSNEQIEFSKQLIEQWSNFIKYGQPNSTRFQNQWRPIDDISNGFIMQMKMNQSQMKKFVIPSSVQFWMNTCSKKDDNTVVYVKNQSLIYEISFTVFFCANLFLTFVAVLI